MLQNDENDADVANCCKMLQNVANVKIFIKKITCVVFTLHYYQILHL